MDKRVNIGISGIAGSGKDTLAAMLLEELHTRGFTEYFQYSFAYPLKVFSQEVFGFSYEDVFTQEGKEASFVRTYKREEMKARFMHSLSNLLKLLSINERPVLVNGSEEEQLERYWERFNDVLVSERLPNSVLTAFAGWWSTGSAIVTYKTTPRIILQLLGTEFFRDNISESFWTSIAPLNDTVISDMRFPNELDSVQERGGITIGILGRNQNTTTSSAHASENVGPVIDKCAYVVHNTGTLDDLRKWANDLIDKEFGERK